MIKFRIIRTNIETGKVQYSKWIYETEGEVGRAIQHLRKTEPGFRYTHEEKHFKPGQLICGEEQGGPS